MAEHEDAIVEAGAEIVWVLEYGNDFQAGTAKSCVDHFEQMGVQSQGWCVGDGQSKPEENLFDQSEFAIGRGFDMIVSRDTMTIDWVSTHGSPGGNENLDGDEVLAAVELVAGGR